MKVSPPALTTTLYLLLSGKEKGAAISTASGSEIVVNLIKLMNFRPVTARGRFLMSGIFSRASSRVFLGFPS